MVKHSKWSQKIVIVYLLPMIAIILIAITVITTLLSQSYAINNTLQIISSRQLLANDFAQAIANMRFNSLSLVANSDNSKIRQYAVSSIQASDQLVKTTTKLKYYLPNEAKIDRLLAHLTSLKNTMSEIIKAGKSSKHINTMQMISTIAQEQNIIKALAKDLVQLETEKRPGDISHHINDSKNFSLILLVVVIFIVVLSAIIVWFLKGLLLSKLNALNQKVSNYADAKLTFELSNNNKVDEDQLGTTSNSLSSSIENLKNVIDDIRELTTVRQKKAEIVDESSAKTVNYSKKISADILSVKDAL